MDIYSRLDDEHRTVYDQIPQDLFAVSDAVAARRRLSQLMGSRPRRPWSENVELQEHRTVAGASGVTLRLYRPVPTDPSSALPALYWLHGGGLIFGSAAMDDDYCAHLAERLQIVVVSADYRLAPEHPYPAPLDDCYAGLMWLAENAAELNIDGDRIAVGGGSAGGGLAAALCHKARDQSGPTICFQFLIYPMLDDRPSSVRPVITDDRVWTTDVNRFAWNAYLDGRAGQIDIDPYAAVARAHDLRGLPPAYISVGDLDVFAVEDIDYASALIRAGVPTELKVYPGAFHGSNAMIPRSELSRRWAADERDALRRAFRSPN